MPDASASSGPPASPDAPRDADEQAGATVPGRLDLSGRRRHHGLKNKIARVLWGVVWMTLFRLSPRPMHRWRVMLLNLFGAKVDATAHVYPSAKVWAPWNLVMGPRSCLGDHVDCYAVTTITLHENAIVSQYAYLCGATHDFEDPKFPLRPAPITLGEQSWVAADAFVGPGVTIGAGTVVGARSSVFRDLPPWKVCVGSPAKPIRDRVIRDGSAPAPEADVNTTQAEVGS